MDYSPIYLHGEFLKIIEAYFLAIFVVDRTSYGSNKIE